MYDNFSNFQFSKQKCYNYSLDTIKNSYTKIIKIYYKCQWKRLFWKIVNTFSRFLENLTFYFSIVNVVYVTILKLKFEMHNLISELMSLHNRGNFSIYFPFPFRSKSLTDISRPGFRPLPRAYVRERQVNNVIIYVCLEYMKWDFDDTIYPWSVFMKSIICWWIVILFIDWTWHAQAKEFINNVFVCGSRRSC